MSQPRIPDGYLLGAYGKVHLEHFDACGNGHSPTRPGWGKCPACGRMTMCFTCADLHCDGVLTSTAHRRVCGKR